jgi:hypothetical protein
MATRWLESIRSTGELSVFPGSSLTGSWPVVFSNALQEFNKLSNAHQFGVRLTRSPVGVNRFMTGANVQFEASDTALTFADTFLGPQTMTLAGTGSAAKTRPLPSGNGGRLGQALILVPSTPKVFAGPTGKRTLREAGDPIKLVIAIHELIHACGLDDDDHTTFNQPDIFSAALVDDADPKDPAKDREQVGSKNGIPITVPPVFIGALTAVKIQALWLIPNLPIHFPRTF